MQPRPNYRIAVTTMEKFRRFIENPTKFDTEQALYESITGAFKGNDKTYIGQAFHAIIEEPRKHNPLHWQGSAFVCVEDIIEDTAIALPMQAAQVALAYHHEHLNMFHEIPVGKMYHTSRGNIYISGRTDGMENIAIRDAKTKFSNGVRIEQYTRSSQWRFYLDITSSRVFYYDIFEMCGYNGWPPIQNVRVTEDLWKKIAFIDVVVHPHEEIACWAYDGIHEELLTLIEQFMDWIDFRGYYHHLTQCDERGFRIPKAPLPAAG